MWLEILHRRDYVCKPLHCGRLVSQRVFHGSPDFVDSLTNQPALLQSYVEAVVVYSDAFRKAQEASQEAESAVEEEAPAPSTDGKKPAEKTTSRRRSGSSKSASAA